LGVLLENRNQVPPINHYAKTYSHSCQTSQA
jgi:hypothetical protein